MARRHRFSLRSANGLVRFVGRSKRPSSCFQHIERNARIQMPHAEHVLEQEDRVVVMKVHVSACLHPCFPTASRTALAVSFSISTDATRVKLDLPFFLGHLSCELGRVLEDDHMSPIVDVCEELPNGGASLHSPGRQPARRQGVKQIPE